VKWKSRASCWQRHANNASVYWKSLPLRPGLYKRRHRDQGREQSRPHRYLGAASTCPSMTTTARGFFADPGGQMERVPSKDIGTGNFVIGNTYVSSSGPTGPRFRSPSIAQTEAELLDAGL
jgi:hypothetical protein